MTEKRASAGSRRRLRSGQLRHEWRNGEQEAKAGVGPSWNDAEAVHVVYGDRCVADAEARARLGETALVRVGGSQGEVSESAENCGKAAGKAAAKADAGKKFDRSVEAE